MTAAAIGVDFGAACVLGRTIRRRRSVRQSNSFRKQGETMRARRRSRPGAVAYDGLRVDELARSHTEEAIAQLAELMRSEDARISLAAATALLERGWGKGIPDANQGGRDPVIELMKAIDGRSKNIPGAG
jgi:hypothetical protein